MTFNPDQFMTQPADPMQTVYENIKEGEYTMMLDTEIEFNEMKWNDKNTGEPRSLPQMTLSCIVQDGGLGAQEKARLGRDKLTVRLQLPLDVTPSGTLDFGPNKNIRLGQLRDALGQNVPGWTPNLLRGAGPFIGKVTHRADKNDPTKKYAEVAKIAKA